MGEIMTRLQELVKQATHDVLGVKQLDSIILAELIVAECAQVCQQVTSSGMFDGNQQYASAYCRDEIKRHFGLE